jgi:hypothetical protein
MSDRNETPFDFEKLGRRLAAVVGPNDPESTEEETREHRQWLENLRAESYRAWWQTRKGRFLERLVNRDNGRDEGYYGEPPDDETL